MKKSLLVSTAAILVVAGAGAVAQTYEGWGQMFTFGDFTPHSLDIAVATEKNTGHKMNLVRLKNGHMMVLVPASRVMGLMTPSEDDMVQ